MIRNTNEKCVLLCKKIAQEDDKMDLMIRVHDTGKYGKDIMCRVDR